jgi:hypothetical protein
MISNLDDVLRNMKGKYKDLKKKHASLQDSYQELKTSHEKLKEAHNSHISQGVNNVKVNVGITCDLLDDMSSVEKVSKSSISTSCVDFLAIPCSSNVDSCMNDLFPWGYFLIVENDELRNIIDCLTKVLINCHRGENTYNKM